MSALLESLPPILSAGTRVLVLGSMPGTVSLRERRYYAHPRNRFWAVMEAICGVPRELPYGARVEALAERGVGLWDVLARCTRAGSSLDAAIEQGSEEANDIAGLLRRRPSIAVLAFNGRKAGAAFRRHVLPALPVEAAARTRLYDLPSTSPANASASVEALVAAWSRLAEHVHGARGVGHVGDHTAGGVAAAMAGDPGTP